MLKRMGEEKESVEKYFQEYQEHILDKLKRLLEKYESNVLEGMEKVITEEKEALKQEILDLLHEALKNKS